MNGKTRAKLKEKYGLSHTQCEALDEVRATDGAEIHRGRWKTFDVLVEKGLATSSGARGPGRDWKRYEPITIASYPEDA